MLSNIVDSGTKGIAFAVFLETLVIYWALFSIAGDVIGFQSPLVVPLSLGTRGTRLSCVAL